VDRRGIGMLTMLPGRDITLPIVDHVANSVSVVTTEATFITQV